MSTCDIGQFTRIKLLMPSQKERVICDDASLVCYSARNRLYDAFLGVSLDTFTSKVFDRSSDQLQTAGRVSLTPRLLRLCISNVLHPAFLDLGPISTKFRLNKAEFPTTLV